MRGVRILFFGGGVVAIVVLVSHLGAGSIAAAFTHVTWWQFALICFVYGVNIAVDTLGWQCTLLQARAPFHKLLAGRCASEASNALTVLAAVGGEAIKAWLIRFEIPYEESVPSLILAKTAEVLGQTLLLALGILVAVTTGLVGQSLLLTAMSYLLVVQVLAVGGFVLVQITGIIGRAARLLSWAGIRGTQEAQHLDAALQEFYRREWRRFLLSTALHFGGALIAVVETLVILYSFQKPPSVAVALVVEALWSGVRFVTFIVPGSLGPLEGANAAAFPALGLAASAGLAFTLVRRARQVVWIGFGLVVLIAMRPGGAARREAPATHTVEHRARGSGHLADSPGAAVN